MLDKQISTININTVRSLWNLPHTRVNQDCSPVLETEYLVFEGLVSKTDCNPYSALKGLITTRYIYIYITFVSSVWAM